MIWKDGAGVATGTAARLVDSRRVLVVVVVELREQSLNIFFKSSGQEDDSA